MSAARHNNNWHSGYLSHIACEIQSAIQTHLNCSAKNNRMELQNKLLVQKAAHYQLNEVHLSHERQHNTTFAWKVYCTTTLCGSSSLEKVVCVRVEGVGGFAFTLGV